jgi:hypothetical protein
LQIVKEQRVTRFIVKVLLKLCVRKQKIEDVIVHPSVKNDEAEKVFPDFRIVKPYLRFAPLPKEKTSAALG